MIRKFLTGAMCAIASVWLNNSATAQENQNPIDTLANSVKSIQDKMSVPKVKISGYIQAQFQVADSSGISSYAGGNFPANVDKRFSVRRGRLKATYDGKLSQYVLQVDVTQSGVGIKDAYVKITEPWTESLTLKAGVQDRPFGYEIGYSSSQRESPERGRMSQILFPGERDLGAMITFQRPKGKSFDYLKIEGGMFNGTGATANDFDFQKDFIGRIRIDRTTKNEKIMYGLGASYYKGGWRNGTSSVWEMEKDSAGLMAFQRTKDTVNYGAINRRSYTGIDAQVSVDWIAGLTTIRGEYIWGTQPAPSGSAQSSTTSPSAQPTADAYFRNFNGAYFYFIQNIVRSKFDLIVKYDWYDPNTEVAGNDIAKNVLAFSGKTYKATNAADLKLTTLGLGLIFKVDANVKFVAYYDMVTNETTHAMNSAGTAFNLSPYHRDLKDNVLTLRMQYKF